MTGQHPQPGSGTGPVGDHLEFRSGGGFHGPVLGKGTQNVYYPAAAQTRAPWPHQVGMIPPTAASFQDRTERARLRRVLAAGGTAEVEGARAAAGGVLSGMGGVGKTQLAADYARTAWQAGELDVLVWVTATSRQAVVARYAQAAAELLAADPADPAAAEAFLAWLEPAPQRPCRWLVVLDDITDPEDLDGLWPPAVPPTGRILATTRRKDAALTGHRRHLIEVGLFTPTEAIAHLTDALADRGRTEPADQLAALAADIGHLPLALAQAAAYLIDTKTNCAEYRERLADRAARLADAAPKRLPDGHPHTAATAWELSIERADAMPPAGLARPMLELAAFLDPNGIPQAVLTDEVVLAHLTAHRDYTGRHTTTGQPVGAVEAADALGTLDRLSLITHTPEHPSASVRVHQLLQRAVRDTITPDQYQRLAGTAADALTAAWPEVERDTALAGALRANTAALRDCAEEHLLKAAAHPVLFRAGRSLGDSGQVAAARDYFDPLVATAARNLGPEHPDTLKARYEHARWQGEAGDAARAATALTALGDDQTRVLSPNHPDTLVTRRQLAQLRGEAGDAPGAAADLTELQARATNILGTDHPDTLHTRHQLAWWRGEAGDAAGATTVLTHLLDDRLRLQGPAHHDTLDTRAALAHWRGQAGDPAGAVAALDELQDDALRILGPHHPGVLLARHMLAYWRGETGDAAGAAAALAELVKDQIQVLGPDHPQTLNARDNASYWRSAAGDAAGAAPALAELVADRVRVLGSDHPDTLSTRHGAAYWRGRAGDAAGAAAAFTGLVA
ncbi:FxSxx-COOH system tetratricopeptide repeat protein, partial [Kitasatospora nipponensis]